MSTKKEKSFEEAVIAAINKYRALHGVPMLKSNAKLHKHAKKQAQLRVKGGHTVHSRDDIGENVFMINIPKVDPTKLVEKWYEEIELYDFDEPENSNDASNFTQLIWKDTSEVGVGFAYGGGWLYVVANFYKAGNTASLYEQNVLPPIRALQKPQKSLKLQRSNDIPARPTAFHRQTEPHWFYVPKTQKVKRLLSINTTRLNTIMIDPPKQKQFHQKSSDIKLIQPKPVMLPRVFPSQDPERPLFRALPKQNPLPRTSTDLLPIQSMQAKVLSPIYLEITMHKPKSMDSRNNSPQRETRQPKANGKLHFITKAFKKLLTTVKKAVMNVFNITPNEVNNRQKNSQSKQDIVKNRL